MAPFSGRDQDEDECSCDHAQDRGHPQCPVPVSGCLLHAGASDVAQATAQWDGEVEDGQHERTRVLGEEVANDSGGDGGVAGLTDAHQPPGQDQQPEVLLGNEGAGEGDGRPEENATAENHLPVEAVAQVAEDGGSHHEATDEH